MYIINIFTTLLTSTALAFTGDLTSYDASTDNQFCGFKKESWNYDGMLTAAINNDQISNSTACGLCASVDYNGKKTTVLIDNLCPECKFGDLDLSHEAWQSVFGNTDYSRIKASWEFVECTKHLSGTLKITPYSINYWWLSVTPSNMRCGVSEMYISFSEGSWLPMEISSRMNGLYFIYSAHVSGPFKFKLISKLGESLETKWYDSIEQVFETGQQFNCDGLELCG